MNSPKLLPGVGFALFGVAYLFIPNSIYHSDFGLGSLRGIQSESSELSNEIMWVYRFIGVCFVVMSISYLF